MNLSLLLWVGAGGFVGSVLRYGAHVGVTRYAPGFPLATLVINVVGCLAIGFLVGLDLERKVFSPEVRALLVIGLLGGFTTFSTFGYETYALLKDQQTVKALANVGLSVALGLVAVWIGISAARAIP